LVQFYVIRGVGKCQFANFRGHLSKLRLFSYKYGNLYQFTN
jgi:hypothetical protein